MENYKIVVQILSVSDEVVGEFELNSQEYEKVKNDTGRDIIGQGVDTVLSELRDVRRTNPHHHMNRFD